MLINKTLFVLQPQGNFIRIVANSDMKNASTRPYVNWETTSLSSHTAASARYNARDTETYV